MYKDYNNYFCKKINNLEKKKINFIIINIRI